MNYKVKQSIKFCGVFYGSGDQITSDETEAIKEMLKSGLIEKTEMKKTETKQPEVKKTPEIKVKKKVTKKKK